MKRILLFSLCLYTFSFETKAQEEHPLTDSFIAERDSAYSLYLSSATSQTFDPSNTISDYTPYLQDGFQIYNTFVLQSLLYSWQLENGNSYYQLNDTGYYNLDDSTVWFYKVSEYTVRKKYMDQVINNNIVYSNVYLYNIREFVINKSSAIDSPWRTQNDYYLITDNADAILSSYIFSRDVFSSALGLSLKILNPGGIGKPGKSPVNNEPETEAVIYPNPAASEKVVLDLYNIREDEEMVITITDMAGKVCRKEIVNIQSGRFVSKTISVGNMPAGVYMVQLVSASVNMSKKLSVIH